MSINVIGPARCPERPFVVRAATAVLDRMKAISAEIQRRSQIRRDCELLMAMPDHLLMDIGIRCSEIDFALEHGREMDRIRDEGRL